MKVASALYDFCADKAKQVAVETLSIGIGYTAVTTSDGGIGLAYTYFETKKSCSMVETTIDYEGKRASLLLEKLHSEHPIERSAAFALVNALNHSKAMELPQDTNNTLLYDTLEMREGTRIAMVGLFAPLLRAFESRKALVEVLDASRGVGNPGPFYEKLGSWAHVLILTSTSLLNGTCEGILGRVGKGVTTVLLGPSTPMVPEAFRDLPVQVLAGSVPTDRERVLKAVRHGMGTPMLHKYSRKVLQVLQ